MLMLFAGYPGAVEGVRLLHQVWTERARAHGTGGPSEGRGGVGRGGGYLRGHTDNFGAPRGAAGFWIAAVASLMIAGAGVLAYFLRISAQTIPAPATTTT